MLDNKETNTDLLIASQEQENLTDTQEHLSETEVESVFPELTPSASFEDAYAEEEFVDEDEDDYDSSESLENPEFFHDALSSLWTTQDLIRWVYSYLLGHDVYFGHGFDNAWDEARALVFNRIHLPYDTNEGYLLNSKLTDYEKRDILNLVIARVHKRIPLAYLIRSARFLNRNYYIDQRVIIPRSPIGELIENGFLGISPKLPATILDLCCGSGVLAIAMADKFKEAQVDGIDISEDAIDVANINLELSDDPSMSERMAFIVSDLYEALPPEMTYDLIVSNPPYVDEYDLATMPKEYHAEPAISLGSGADGLEVTSRILAESHKHLNPQGVLICEVGNSRYALEEALPDIPFNWVELKRGGHGVFAITREQLIAHLDALEAFRDSKLVGESKI